MKTLVKFGAAVVLAAGVAGATALPASAQTDIFRAQLSDMCSDAARDAVANDTRRTIENHVRRAEASIQPPTPIDALGCISDLMAQDLSVLSNSIFNFMNLFNSLSSGLTAINIDGLIANVGDRVVAQICQVAERKWNELTRPLMASLSDLEIGLAPGFTDNFGLLNLGGGTFIMPEASSAGFAAPRPAGGEAIRRNVGSEIEQIWETFR